jgi:hypothetical protein
LKLGGVFGLGPACLNDNSEEKCQAIFIPHAVLKGTSENVFLGMADTVASQKKFPF